MPSRRDPVVLVILDGWGCAPAGPGNAVELADTPVFDRLWRAYPHTTLKASGEAVGLPPGQMGNSEVGHLTIGSGRVLDQDLQRVNRAIADGSFVDNPALKAAFEHGGDVHLLGLVSHGGVHSHIDHLQALLRFAPERTWVHAFTDGRDVSPTSAVRDLAELPLDRIATVAGRYWAMDRDQRWDRTQRAFDAIVNGEGEHTDDHKCSRPRVADDETCLQCERTAVRDEQVRDHAGPDHPEEEALHDERCKYCDERGACDRRDEHQERHEGAPLRWKLPFRATPVE